MTPDVSVIVAVHNTEALLPKTLDSLRRQTLGPHRVQVVLVNDGSVDHSGRQCDEFAATYPGPVEVRHQENSGTPAVPFNRGLELATGRYVFFLGSDDYLWDEALERLVDAADRWESDVIFGRVTGVDGHAVAQQVYQHGTVQDLDLYTTALPYALANAKLFRRSLIESIGLRYREDMRQRCDQPFTLTAIVEGRRTSLLADGDYYFARPRQDRSNVTYTADYDESLFSTEVVMDTIAALVDPGQRRDHVMKRQFELSLDRLLDTRFLTASTAVVDRVTERIGTLADRYLTESLTAGLPVDVRVRMTCAQRRDSAALLRVISACASNEPDTAVPLVIEGDDVFVALPPFRTPEWSDDIFRTDLRLLTRVSRTVSAIKAAWHEGALVVDVDVQISGLDTSLISASVEPAAAEAARPRARRLTSPRFKQRGPSIPVGVTQQQGTVRCHLTCGPHALPWGVESVPRVRFTVGGFEYDVPIHMLNESAATHLGRRWKVRPFVVTTQNDAAGLLTVYRGPPRKGSETG